MRRLPVLVKGTETREFKESLFHLQLPVLNIYTVQARLLFRNAIESQ